jgi:hypothetical protein
MKPALTLTGENGNAFAILGLAQRAARRAKMPTEDWERIRAEATSGDYNHLLATLMRYFDVQ